VGYACVTPVKGHFAKLIENRGGRRVNIRAEQRDRQNGTLALFDAVNARNLWTIELVERNRVNRGNFARIGPDLARVFAPNDDRRNDVA